MNKIALAILFSLFGFALKAEVFRILEGDGSFLTSKIGPWQEILLVKVLQISKGPYSITNTPSGIFSVSKVFLSSEGLKPGSTIRLYFCPEETNNIRSIRSWHGSDLYTNAEDDDSYCGLSENLSDVKLDHFVFHSQDELLVFCYRHLDDIGREKLIGAFAKPHIQKIESRSFLCFYRNAFRLGDVDLGKLECECRLRRMKVAMAKYMYYALFFAPFLFFLCLRHRIFKLHIMICVAIYCFSWIAVCVITLCCFNADDIGANLLLTVVCIAHAVYLFTSLEKSSHIARTAKAGSRQ